MIWLIGSKGMLGSEIAFQMKKKDIPFIGTNSEKDITDREVLFAFAEAYPGIEWIINCAAYTEVDRQEDDVDKADLLNAIGPANIADVAKKTGAKLIHISTDYVFDGKGSVPYTEDMKICPESVYGKTKAHGEIYVRNILPDASFIIRTSWLYGFDGENFVYNMIRQFNKKESVQVVNDQKGTPTFAGNLAEVVLTLIKKENTEPESVKPGIYHYSNAGETTWFNFACAIYEEAKRTGRIRNNCRITPCSSHDFIHKARRPAYSVLNKDKITQILGLNTPDWQVSLTKFMNDKRFSLQ